MTESSADRNSDDEDLGPVRLQIPGRHNVLNALAALSGGLALGAKVPEMAAGSRRTPEWSDASSAWAKRAASWSSTTTHTTRPRSRRRWPRRAWPIPTGAVVVAFQPHLFTRTRDFAREFGASLAAADAVFLTEIYPAREQPIAGRDVGPRGRSARRGRRNAAWRGERAQLADALASAVRDGDVVVTIGGAGTSRRRGPSCWPKLVEVGRVRRQAAQADVGARADERRTALAPICALAAGARSSSSSCSSARRSGRRCHAADGVLPRSPHRNPRRALRRAR